MATTLGDVKMRIVLEMPPEERAKIPGATSPATPGTPGAPGQPPGASPPGQRIPNPGGDSAPGRGGEDAQDGDAPPGRDGGGFSWDKITGRAARVTSPDLYGEVKGIVSTIPAIGFGYRAIEFARDFGLAGTAAAAEAAKGLPPGIREAAVAAFSAANDVTREAAGMLTKVEVTLQSVSATLDQIKEAASGADALGGLDLDALPELASTLGSVNRFQTLVGSARRQRQSEILGRAVGGLGAQGLDKLFGGASGR